MSRIELLIVTMAPKNSTGTIEKFTDLSENGTRDEDNRSAQRGSIGVLKWMGAGRRLAI